MRYEIEIKFHKDFIAIDGNKIMIGLSSKPQQGKANRELIKKISKHFNLSTSRVRIIAGEKSRKKIIEIIENN